MKIEIKSRFSQQILFSHECADNSIAITLAAAKALRVCLDDADLTSADLTSADLTSMSFRYASFRGANLRGANLRGANLRNADLLGAYLRGADLQEANFCVANFCVANLRIANLRGAYFRYANLRGADLRGADLRGADLTSADLRRSDFHGADLRSADLGEPGKLAGDRPFFTVGPIGSREDDLVAFQTEKGIFLRAGCFFGPAEEFITKVREEHRDNTHAVEYRAALALIEAHYSAWPATVAEER